MVRYEHLLSPIKINKTIFRNRIFSAPITPFFYTNEHTRPSEGLIEQGIRDGFAAGMNVGGEAEW